MRCFELLERRQLLVGGYNWFLGVVAYLYFWTSEIVNPRAFVTSMDFFALGPDIWRMDREADI
jgi:hypothetical protein